MKKTTTSSIGGMVFNFEDDAHQRLSQYLADVSATLQSSEGHKEIMADIEARIAELFQPKVKGFKQVVTIDDVNEVIAIMGNPQEFGGTGSQSHPPHTQEYVRRRLFRDTEGKLIFGVCSGLGHHFGIDPIWIRLAWVLSVLLFGFGFWLYIILAIIMPKAATAAEKLEMRGEPVDINNIRRKVEDELEYLKKKMKNLKDEYRSSPNGGTQMFRHFGRQVSDMFASLGTGATNVLGTLIKGVFAFIAFILLFICSLLLLSLLVTLWSGVNVIHIHAANGHWIHYGLNNLLSMFAISGLTKNIVLIGISLFIGVPLVGLIIGAGRALLGFKKRSKTATVILGLLWAISWMLIIGTSVSTFGHFSVTGSVTDDLKFNPPSRSLYVSMPQSGEQNVSVRIDSLNFYISDKNLFQGNPSLCIESSPDSLYHLEVIRQARGITTAEAEEMAKNIQYAFAQHDSTLQMDSYFQLAPGSPWRKQKLDLMLQVPMNRSILLPAGIDDILCSAIRKEHRGAAGKKWLMTPAGLVSAP